jgi:hypothetical protein
MSCVLRVSGESFDVDAFFTSCSIEPIKVWRKGEFKFTTHNSGSQKHTASDVNFEVSGAEFSDMKAQLMDSIKWFSENQSLVKRLVSFPGVDGVTADFGAEICPPGWCTFSVPPELQTLIGGLGAHLMLSVYPTSDETPIA